MSDVYDYLAKVRTTKTSPSRVGTLQDMRPYLVNMNPLLDLAGEWGAFFSGEVEKNELETLRQHERIGRPLGEISFVKKLERKLKRPLLPLKGGRPRKEKN